MSTNVDFHNITMDNIVALSVQIVFQTLDSPFITRDNRRRENNGIILLQFDETMIVRHDTGKSRIEFSLGAGTNNNYLIIFVFVNIIHGNECLFLHFDIAEFLGYFDIHFHTIPFERHFLSELFGIFDEIADTTNL